MKVFGNTRPIVVNSYQDIVPSVLEGYAGPIPIFYRIVDKIGQGTTKSCRAAAKRYRILTSIQRNVASIIDFVVADPL